MMGAAVDTSACFIGELPDELLVGIVSHLRVKRGYLADEKAEGQRRYHNAIILHTMYALTLSCRKFNAIATPFLYQCFIQTKAQPCAQVQLRTLMSKRLAPHVQYIEFDTFSCSKAVGYKSPPESDVSKYREQLVAAQGLVLPPEVKLDMASQDAYTVAVPVGPKLCPVLERLWKLIPLNAFAVLLAITDNVQDVAIPDHSIDVLSMVVFKQYKCPGIFRRLWLKGDGSRHFHSPVSIYPVRMMCAIRNAQHGYLAEYLQRLLRPTSPYLETGSPAALEELSLDIFDAKAEDLSLHLEKCTLLERFSCRWRWTEHPNPWHDVNLPALRAGLQRVQNTLTHLTIDTMESAWRVDLDRTIPALGSLREFKALKHLDVAGLVLWGDEDISETSLPLSALLPESLETLIIKTEWDDDVEDSLHQLSVDCAVWLPALESIDCTWTPAPAVVADYLIDGFHFMGVKLVLDVGDGDGAA